MIIGRIQETIRTLLRSRSQATRRLIAHELRELLGAADAVDDETWQQAVCAIEKTGVTPPSRRLPDRLPVGVTYLLLFNPTLSQSALLRARPSTTPGFYGDSLGFSARLQVQVAFTGLVAALGKLGCGLPSDAWARGHLFEIDPSPLSREWVDGSSLGLSAAMAMLSIHSGAVLRDDVAGTARVDAEGNLGPVERVREKVEALQRRWPRVRKLVVAKGQPDVPDSGIEVVRCQTLLEAWNAWGLAVSRENFPAPSVELLRARITQFEHLVAPQNSVEEWSKMATEAAYAAASPGLTEGEKTRAILWGSLFALHAGDPGFSEQLRSGVPERCIDVLGQVAKAWWYVGEACAMIDRDPTLALKHAEKGVEIASRLSGEDQEGIRGKAYGTLGRVYMHCGRHDKALEWLRKGLDYHAAHRPTERGRSSVYLATCLRMSGAPKQALKELARERECERRPDYCATAMNTDIFTLLESGRCHLASGDYVAAERDFLDCATRQQEDSDHPRISALRGLAESFRRRGMVERSLHYLERCLVVAEARGFPFMVRKVSALAAGEALVWHAEGNACHELVRVGRVWQEFYGDPGDLDSVRSEIRRAVY